MSYFKLLVAIHISFFALADETLTIRSSLNESKSYKIKKIRKTRLTKDSGRVLIIETYGPEKCIIPLAKVVSTPRVNYEGCSHCMETDSEVESFYSQLFLNRRQANIRCDVTNGETVGFSFIGGTTVNGKSMFTNNGLLLDSAMYSNGPFKHVEKKKGALRRILDDVEDVLIDIAF